MRERHVMTILVVDSEPVIVRLAADILQRHGYHAMTAEDGREAVDTFRRHGTSICAVVIEQDMPVFSGLEVLNDLLAINPRLGVVLVTDGLSAEPSPAARVPRWRFLSKPWTAEQLVQAVRDVFSPAEN
jgi:DNA-binding NtrC family response regulator